MARSWFVEGSERNRSKEADDTRERMRDKGLLMGVEDKGALDTLMRNVKGETTSIKNQPKLPLIERVKQV